MHIIYRYAVASYPTNSDLEGDLTISKLRSLIISDLAQLITRSSNSLDLSMICESAEYSSNYTSTWNLVSLTDTVLTVTSNNADPSYEKTISFTVDNVLDTDLFFSNVSLPVSADYKTTTLSLTLSVSNGSRTISNINFNYYTMGGVIYLSISPEHLMLCGRNNDSIYDTQLYQPPIGVFDFEQYDNLPDNDPRIVVMDNMSSLWDVSTDNVKYPGNYYTSSLTLLNGSITSSHTTLPSYEYVNYIYFNREDGANTYLGGCISTTCNIYAMHNPSTIVTANGNPIELDFCDITLSSELYAIWPLTLPSSSKTASDQNTKRIVIKK